MQSFSLVKQLSALIDAHNIPFHVKDDWIVPYGKLPAISAAWFPYESAGVLEVEVLLQDKVMINECFAGEGTGEDGMLDALENFCANSLHVLLAAFWERNDPKQVTTEVWEIAAKTYIAFNWKIWYTHHA